ncbi:MAG: TonB-dependent receptor [Muribaculaceae bacterium]|nr:TonB-dependent receptor [Muribaculaceae bacterium]
MNPKSKKAVLLAGAAMTVLACAAPQAYAAPQQNAGNVQTESRITGRVTDPNGEPLIGASVLVKGTSRGTATDIDGNFSVVAKPGDVLTVSYVGYIPSNVKVGDDPVINIELQENANNLDDVVVVGYGVQKKKLVTGATLQVSGDQIAKMNTSNALTALQTSAPGMQITQASTQPGKGFKVNIRGMGTIGESSPLLVIDGIVSGTANDGLNGINPNDIETIDVLKDAASAAIYGARAANGVILVTTKQGKEGKVSLTYDGFVGWSNPYRLPGTLGAKEYMQVINETNFNTYGIATPWNLYAPQAILDKVNAGWKGMDWADLYRNKNAFQQSHAATLSGGNDRSKFSISVNYSKQEGIMGGDNASDFERYGGRVNSEHILVKGKDHSIITIGENLSYWYHSSHDLPEGNGYWNIMQPVYAASPLVPAFNEDGTPTEGGFSTNIFSNPWQGFINGEYSSLNRNRNWGVGATFYWIVEPIKNLKYRGQVNTGYSGYNHRDMTKPFVESSTNSNELYQMNMNASQSSSLSFENTISYALPSFGNNNIDVLVGQSIEKSNWATNMSMSFKDDPNSEAFNTLVLNGWNFVIPSNMNEMTGYSGYDNPMEGRIASFFGRVNYNYDEKYLLTAIVRRDGSNNFARGHRWHTYPSVSAGWVLTNESFMEKALNVMDFFKIRASWGQNGNCQIGNFYYLSNIGFSPTGYADYGYKFSSDMQYTVDGEYVKGAYAKNVPNENLTWETSEQIDLGFDARFLQSRLAVTFDWYRKMTKDWLVQAPLNDVLGYEQAAMINGGDVKNQGVEIGLSWNDNIGGEFLYHVNVNAAYNRNRVTRLASASKRIGDNLSSTLFQGSSYVSLVEVGHPIGYFSGMSHSGIWQNQQQIDDARAAGKAVLETAQPGDFIWDDFDGDGKIDYATDRHEIGDPNPDWTLGINLGFSYKGFDFSAAGSGAFGMQAMQCYRTALLANPYVNYTTDILNRWHGEGTSNTVPRLVVGSENNSWISTYYMQNADYFKMQNITLGYDFCNQFKLPFQQLRVYAQLQNLFTITKYTGVDPEIGSNGGAGDSSDSRNWMRGIDLGLYPSARSFVLGVTIKY